MPDGNRAELSENCIKFVQNYGWVIKLTGIMDIDLLSRMVKEVILDRDRVVLPGLGTFVAEMVPASFSDKGYTINPPYRRLYFRHRMEEDSSLVEIYSSSNNISPELARNILTDFLKELRQVLMEKKTVVLPGLGRLRATKENNFFFVPDEDLDIYPEGFGLEPISLKTHSETKEELSAAMDNLKSIIEPLPAPEQDDVEPEQGAAEPAIDDAAGLVPDGQTAATLDSAAQPEEEAPEHVEADMPELHDSAEPEMPESPASAEEDVPETVVPVMEESAPISEQERKKKRLRRSVMVAVIIVMVLVSLVLIYMILSLLFPGIFDRLLYNDDQLQVLEFFSAY